MPVAVAAAAGADWRVASPLSSSNDSIDYVLSVDDCTRLAEIHVVAGATVSTVSPAETNRETSSNRCELAISARGEGRFAPQATLKFTDGTSQSFSESFVFETQAPTLSLSGVSIDATDTGQQLFVNFDADDDQDIAYLSVSVLGVRASDLRAAGGVIERVREQAFARTESTTRVYPGVENQTSYGLAVAVTRVLDAAAVAQDGVVIVDASAVDASGNRANLSRIAFTGSSVSESALSLQAIPSSITFTNMLESAAIVPSVEFQFRGLTELPGAGLGVRYSSSRPDIVAVTPSGLVYPLAETAGQPVTISVEFGTLPPVLVPVVVDPSKRLVALEADGLDANGHWVLDRLNKWSSLPRLSARFDDGSRSDIGTQFELTHQFGAGATGILDYNDAGEVRARAIVTDASPISLTVALKALPDVKVVLPIVARDGLPSVTLTVPQRAEAGKTLRVIARAEDDVAVRDVKFFMDGLPIGSRSAAPFEVAIDIPEQLANSQVTMHAVATDSAGQSNAGVDVIVNIVRAAAEAIPDLKVEQPGDLSHYVERSPITFQVSREMQEGEDFRDNSVAFVEFFLDGGAVAVSHFPMIEKRQVIGDGGKPKDAFFKLWRGETMLGTVSTADTGISFHALIHGAQGGVRQTPTRLIRVQKNQPPSISFRAPTSGATVSAGQTVSVDLQFADDTLEQGVDVQLFVNDRVFAQRRVTGARTAGAGGATILQGTAQFSVPVDPERIGSGLTLRAKVIDHFEQVASAGPVRINVVTDQPPNVALTLPTEGSHLVAGLPASLNATATDDVGAPSAVRLISCSRIGCGFSQMACYLRGRLSKNSCSC